MGGMARSVVAAVIRLDSNGMIHIPVFLSTPPPRLGDILYLLSVDYSRFPLLRNYERPHCASMTPTSIPEPNCIRLKIKLKIILCSHTSCALLDNCCNQVRSQPRYRPSRYKCLTKCLEIRPLPKV